MSKISFYQVMNEEMIKFSCQLLEKCFLNHIKTFVQVADEALAETLNRTLWTFSQKSFIPHGSDKDPFHEKQPIYISTNPDCPIKATGLMLIGVIRPDIKDFERVIIVINGTSLEETRKAQAFRSELKNLDYQVEYYLQNSAGGWSAKE